MQKSICNTVWLALKKILRKGFIHDWDKGIENYVTLDLNVYYDFLLFDQ